LDFRSQLFANYKLWAQDFVWEWNNSSTGHSNNPDMDSLRMRSFRFRIGVTEFNAPADLVRATNMLREIAARHTDLDIITYQQTRAVADQLNILLPNTIQNDVLAMGCMIVISLLFIPNPICTLWIAIAMVTIDIGKCSGKKEGGQEANMNPLIGVIGFLSLWGVKLDPISMITLVLSIGFSIEFSAHVTYGFVSNEHNLSARQRCIDTMEKLAWPSEHHTWTGIGDLP